MKVYSCCLMGLLLISVLSGCKKSSGGGGSNSPYYLTATVNGNAWAANVTNNSMNTPVLAAVTGSGSSTVILVLGLKAAGKDSSAFAIAFPPTITLNKTVAFDASKYMAAIYAASATASYATSKTPNSDDSLTITNYDQTAKVIEGTFKGTFYLQSGSGSVKITDGKFKTPYVLDASQLPPSNIKM